MSGAGGRLARWAGGALALVSLLFLARRAWQVRASFADWPAGALWAALAAALLSAAGGVALVVAWRALLDRHGGGPLPFGRAFVLHAGTQVAKYIPGNIFQYAGRHLQGRREGIPHGALVLSALGEAAGLGCVAGATVCAGAAWAGELSAPAGTAGGAACLLAYPFVQRALAWGGRRGSAAGVAAPGPMAGADLSALAGHLGFFLCATAAFTTSALPWGGAQGAHPGALAAACAAAWLAGFLTPGAPAGLGVREAVLVVALEGSLGRTGALGAAALYRLATTLGDGLLYGASLALRPRVPPVTPPPPPPRS